jgi:hypothetical protein
MMMMKNRRRRRIFIFVRRISIGLLVVADEAEAEECGHGAFGRDSVAGRAH